jgi:FkbM family methyltransferase
VALRRPLNKPHYVFRPAQALRRLAASRQTRGVDETVVRRVPWGAEIQCWPADAIGSSIVRTGIYDLLAVEALFRLVDPGDVAVDAGANIGHMTSALATAAGPRGRVISFEPHPEVLAVLERNVQRWRGDSGVATIDTYGYGLSRNPGRATLVVSQDFQSNRGTSRIVAEGDISAHADVIEITLVRLDDMVQGPVGLLKLDVEGHEAAVLDGAAGMLSAGAVRDIVFEEERRPPTEATKLLQGHGYHVRELLQELWGPRLVSPGTDGARGSWDPPVLVASRDVQRLERRFSRWGWRALRPGRRRRSRR